MGQELVPAQKLAVCRAGVGAQLGWWGPVLAPTWAPREESVSGSGVVRKQQ